MRNPERECSTCGEPSFGFHCRKCFLKKGMQPSKRRSMIRYHKRVSKVRRMDKCMNCGKPEAYCNCEEFVLDETDIDGITRED